jgi:hypothetical protein
MGIHTQEGKAPDGAKENNLPPRPECEPPGVFTHLLPIIGASRITCVIMSKNRTDNSAYQPSTIHNQLIRR